MAVAVEVEVVDGIVGVAEVVWWETIFATRSGAIGVSAELPPGVFAIVMANGIVAVVARIAGILARRAGAHTGRSLTADRVTDGLFIAVTLSALLRVVAQLLTSVSYVTLLGMSATPWVLAFGGSVMRDAPILLTPRPDGEPG